MYAVGALAGTSADRVTSRDDIYAFDSTVFDTLVRRLDAPNDALAQSSASLLLELVSINSDAVMDRMVLSHLLPFSSTLLSQTWSGVASDGGLDDIGSLVDGDDVVVRDDGDGDSSSEAGTVDKPKASASAPSMSQLLRGDSKGNRFGESPCACQKRGRSRMSELCASAIRWGVLLPDWVSVRSF